MRKDEVRHKKLARNLERIGMEDRYSSVGSQRSVMSFITDNYSARSQRSYNSKQACRSRIEVLKAIDYMTETDLHSINERCVTQEESQTLIEDPK